MEKNNYLKYADLNLRQNVYQLILTFVVSLYISFSIVRKFDSVLTLGLTHRLQILFQGYCR